MKPARKVVSDSLGVQPGEELLVVYDTRVSGRISESIVSYARSIDVEVVSMLFPAREYIPDKPWMRQEPPKVVAEAMKRADAVFVHTTTSMSYAAARKTATAEGVRILSAPRLTEEEIIRTTNVDLEELSSISKKVADVQKNAKRIKITTPGGTDVSWEQKGAAPMIVDGVCRTKGSFSQLPSGASACVPQEGSAEGVVVIDGMLHNLDFPLSEPIRLTIKEGRITKIEGGKEAAQFRKKVAEANDANAFTCPAEWAVGTNAAANLTPQIEGERCYGLINTGIGGNTHIPGGNVQSRFHLDGVMLSPKLEVDGRVILENRTFSL